MSDKRPSKSGTIEGNRSLLVFPSKHPRSPHNRVGDTQWVTIVGDKQGGCGRMHLVAGVVAGVGAVAIGVVTVTPSRHGIVEWIAWVAHADAKQPVLTPGEEERGHCSSSGGVIVPSGSALVVSIGHHGVVVAVVGCPG